MINIDLSNPPEQILVTTGKHKEVTCKRHFLKRFRKEGVEYTWGFLFVDQVEPYSGTENCFDCTHNP